jgi:hypothetical protein
VLHHDYPGHDVTALGVAHTASAAQAREDHIPKSFAWPAANGGPAYDDEDDVTGNPTMRHRAKTLVVPANGGSEYARSFVDPPHEAYLNRTRPEKPVAGKALDLFAEDAGNVNARQRHDRLVSESHAEFHAFPDAPSPSRVTAASRTIATNQNYPTQFAWSLVNGGEKTLENPARSKRPPQPTQDMSEYSRKFNWPPPIERSPPRRGGTSAATKEAKDSILGLDVGSMGGGQWQSEYDQQCARLRQKQEELRTSGGNTHIAGVASRTHGTIPTYYAWEIPTAPAAEVHDEPATEVVHSEYEDNFKQWPVTQREAIKPRLEADTLNLFRQEPVAESKTTTGDAEESQNALVHARKQLKSEYTDQFHPFDASVTRPPTATGVRGLPLPPQFAWPRVDPPVPPSEHVKSADEVPFREVSESHEKFAWPAVIQPATIARPAQSGPAAASLPGALTSSVIVPIPEKDSDQPEHWVSEYGAHAADAVHGDDGRSRPAAGTVTTVQKNIPHFYAWRERDAPPPPPLKAVVPRYHGEPVRSEYDDSFTGWPVTGHAAVTAPAKAANANANALNLFSDRSNLSGPAGPLKSEYHAQFVPHTAEEVKSLANPFAAVKSSAIEEPKPPQFAWPLVDAQPAREPVKTVDSALAPHSEYDAQFVWRGSADSDAALALATKARAASAARTAPIPLDQDAMRPADWSSEYDAQCAALRQKQEELSQRTVQQPIAGRHTVPAEEPPAFYAYNVLGKHLPPHLYCWVYLNFTALYRGEETGAAPRAQDE